MANWGWKRRLFDFNKFLIIPNLAKNAGRMILNSLLGNADRLQTNTLRLALMSSTLRDKQASGQEIPLTISRASFSLIMKPSQI